MHDKMLITLVVLAAIFSGSNEMDPPLSNMASRSQNGCRVLVNHSP
jgi:hypothetical protein